ncbi:MAG: four helix bundle protein [Lentisphaeraceae bacterium]|nr:four helix bundle protein [Lentisphaeraceae bacterium]
MKSYKDLIVWQKSMKLVSEIYKVTRNFPDTEKFGLVSQMRRSAVSIPSNIAEGYGRGSKVEYARYVKISRGSMYELDTQVEIARTQDFLNNENYKKITGNLEEIGRMLNGLVSALQKTSP